MDGVRAYAPGVVVIREGDASVSEMFVLLSGTCGLYKFYGQRAQRQYAILRAGDIFAVMSLFGGEAPKETVVAHEPCVMLALTRQAALALFRRLPEEALGLTESICVRLGSTESAYEAAYAANVSAQAEAAEARAEAVAAKAEAVAAKAEAVAAKAEAAAAKAEAAEAKAEAVAAKAEAAISRADAKAAQAKFQATAQATTQDTAQATVAKPAPSQGASGAPYAEFAKPARAIMAPNPRPVPHLDALRRPNAALADAKSEARPPSRRGQRVPRETIAPSANPSGLRRLEGGNPSGGSPLFPPGHRFDLALPMEGQELSILFMREFHCPLCKTAFRSPVPRASRLANTGEDMDLRVWYKNIEPMYYDIIVCPQCWLAAADKMFGKAIASRSANLARRIEPIREGIDLQTNEVRDTFSVFAAHYLALLSAECVFPNHELVLAGIWLRLSRLYDDCGDPGMSRRGSGESLRLYLEAYSRCDISSRQIPRVLYIIGNLAYKLGDVRQARKFLFEAKTSRDAGSVLKGYADMRLDDVRALDQAGHGQEGGL